MPSLELRPDPASPGQARMFVRRLMADWDVDPMVGDDAELLVTELVTNAVIHARTSVRIDVAQHDGHIEVAVTDKSSRQIQLRIPSEESVTGRGIYLLDQLSPDWEVVPVSGGKMIRFNLATEATSRVNP